MFTGLITDLGKLEDISKLTGRSLLEIQTNYKLSDILVGASIACNGCCLTVVRKKPQSIIFDVSNETLNCTSLSSWVVGEKINLEKSLKIGDELGGHLVSGHVDFCSQISKIEPDGDSLRFSFHMPRKYSTLIAKKGSITVDGISLTVNAVKDTEFEVNVIPHTYSVTTLGHKKEGQKVNVEIDLLARYVARALSKQ